MLQEHPNRRYTVLRKTAAAAGGPHPHEPMASRHSTTHLQRHRCKRGHGHVCRPRPCVVPPLECNGHRHRMGTVCGWRLCGTHPGRFVGSPVLRQRPLSGVDPICRSPGLRLSGRDTRWCGLRSVCPHRRRLHRGRHPLEPLGHSRRMRPCAHRIALGPYLHVPHAFAGF